MGGSFACVQALNDAIKTKQYGTIISMTLIELVVAMFEVLFLYRELVDAITPWMAQQGFNMGIVGTLALAFAGWLGVRGMTWFLFGRYGTPALIAVLARETISHGGSVDIAPPKQPEFWRAPITALKAEVEWFKTEAREMFELLTLPVLQLMAVRVQLLAGGAAGAAALHPAVPLPGRGAVRRPRSASSGKHRPHGFAGGRMKRALLPCGPRRGDSRVSVPKGGPPPKSTLVIGLDVSGSFRKGGHYEDAIDFASLYIYAHMKGFQGAAPAHRSVHGHHGRTEDRRGQDLSSDPGPHRQVALPDCGQPPGLVPGGRPDHRFQRLLRAGGGARAAAESRPPAAQHRDVLGWDP